MYLGIKKKKKLPWIFRYLAASPHILNKSIYSDSTNTYQFKNNKDIVLSAAKESCTFNLKKVDCINKMNRFIKELLMENIKR